ncbi:Hypothetical protein R9X50_00655200 [Acrodontium crateriforme]|uniref:Uncharacterized protein n=1 Tax=Acrodontium crateriforme TaxID=150365 RepID=A0AAQ3M937_9PEZI|nr:Hypothetical protein R9X50_00655200 [Acrodontium crateriforme]
MGRDQYLARLILGRSAFEDLEPNNPSQIQRIEELNGRISPPSSQLYDGRGRPFNPEIAARNAEMRNAQNSVLALVGVVEKRDEDELRRVEDSWTMRQALNRMLEEEHGTGESLQILTDAAPFFLMLPAAMILRLQIGLLDPNKSFFELASSLWQPEQGSGFCGMVGALIPGGVALIVAGSARALIQVVIGGACGEIQEALIKGKRFRHKTLMTLVTSMSTVYVALQCCAEFALIPLDYYARAQFLGLAPVTPLIPSFAQLMSRKPDSLYQAAWNPVICIPILGTLSAAIVQLVQAFVKYDTDLSRPINEALTDFVYPEHLLHPMEFAPENTLVSDPIGFVLYNLYNLRVRAMRWCGWWQKSENGSHRTFSFAHGMNLLHKPGDPGVPRRRTTALATLPAEFVASSIDFLLIRLFMLVPKSLLLRIDATSYMQSSLQKSPQAAVSAGQLYLPFGGGPMGRLWTTGGSTSSWTHCGLYASKIGLAICLSTTVETAIFGCVYGMVRSKGRKFYSWGRSSLDEIRLADYRRPVDDSVDN